MKYYKYCKYLVLILAFLLKSSFEVAKNTIVYVPLDERFATRGMFLNLARVVSEEYEISTPPMEYLSNLKVPADLDKIYDWFDQTLKVKCSYYTMKSPCIIILGTETFFYGGLIASRSSNDTLETLTTRVLRVIRAKFWYTSNIRLYLSTVVMRIPAYNGDFEEP